MKKLLLTLALCMGYLCTTVAQTFVKTEVKQSMRRVADWQIAHYNKAIYGDLNWVNATFYLGLVHWAAIAEQADKDDSYYCLLYTSPSPRDRQKSRMPSSA